MEYNVVLSVLAVISLLLLKGEFPEAEKRIAYGAAAPPLTRGCNCQAALIYLRERK